MRNYIEGFQASGHFGSVVKIEDLVASHWHQDYICAFKNFFLLVGEAGLFDRPKECYTDVLELDRVNRLFAKLRTFRIFGGSAHDKGTFDIVFARACDHKRIALDR